MAAAIARGLALPERELPSPKAEGRAAPSAAVKRRVAALRTWRDAQAERLRLDPAIVLSQRVIERIAAAAPGSLDELAAIDGVRRWRVAEWGPALLAAAA